MVTKKKYSRIKLKNEKIFQKLGHYGLKVSIARCFTFVGEFLPKNSNYIIHNKVPKIYPGKWVEVLKGNNNKDSIYLTTGAIIKHVINNFLKKKKYFLYSLPLWGMKFKKNQFNHLKKYKKISVVEDHFQDGGFQSWLSESLKNKSLETVVISKSINYKVVGKVGSKEYLMKYLY